jgi:response regulator RpfG family c-di-GMP phosphodiesterase
LQSIYLKQIIQDNQREIIIRLTEVVENRSKETGNHIRRVALYSELLAKKYGLPDEDVQILKYASPLHDIGKVAIPDAVLNKPGKLDDEEWHVMQQHASKGMGMLENSDIELLRAGSIIAGQHHERWDGEGYPDKLSGEDIHIYGRITAVADVFDALLSKRCYKESWSIDQVIDYFKEASGKQFQPALVSILLDDLNEFVAILDAHPD